MKFWIVDAFADKPFAGNPAGVLIVEDFPDVILMQNIASELNLSETAFVKKLSEGYYHIRWFTPNSEAPLCGHATIAAVHVIRLLSKEGLALKKFVFQSVAGNFIVTTEDELITLHFPKYKTEQVEKSGEIMDVVNFIPIYLGFSHNCFFMEFAEIDEIINLKVNLSLLSEIECRALIVTSKGAGVFHQYDFISRYFAPRVGINEDPVCASAHCRLAPYWSKKLNKKNLVAYQASKRGGVIKCEEIDTAVLISGCAKLVMRGELC